MKRVAVLIVVGTVAGLVWLAGPGQASLYEPDEKNTLLPMGTEGKPLPPEEMKRRLVSLGNLFMPNRMANGMDNRDRLDYLKAQDKPIKTGKATPDEVVARAVFHLRLGQADKAVELLNPLTREPRPGYFAYVTLGHAFAANGDWFRACEYHDLGREIGLPATVKGWTKAQRDWCKHIDDEYVLPYYRIHNRESDARKGTSQAQLDKIYESEDIFPLFPPSTGRSPNAPVRFVNEAGVYQPGRLDAAEMAKLPPDAVAIVQQMLLWYPQDTRLFWLLAELYAATGNLQGADMFFDMCAGPRQYGNRKVMMKHREAVRSALPANAPPAEIALTPDQPTENGSPAVEPAPVSMQTVKYYFAAVGVVVLFAIIRGKIRRSRAERS